MKREGRLMHDTIRMPRMRQIVTSVAVICIASSDLFARWRAPPRLPLGRVANNIAAYIKEHPNEAHGYYLLGRVHDIAYTYATRDISAFIEDSAPYLPRFSRVAPDMNRIREHNSVQIPMANDERLPHLAAALRSFATAIEKSPKDAQTHLSYASLLERAAADAGNVDFLPLDSAPIASSQPESMPSTNPSTYEVGRFAAQLAELDKQRWIEWNRDLPKISPLALSLRCNDDPNVKERARTLLTAFWNRQALLHYFEAVSLSVEPELQKETHWGKRELVSFEAADCYRKLRESLGTTFDIPDEKTDEIEVAWEKLDARDYRMAITPIVFSLGESARVEELLDDRCAVKFDLDGDGLIEYWPWVRSDTAFLVWLGDDNAPTTSARQMFGSVTWWMFYRDGYQALDSLDDDRDGWLRGAELDGIGVWTDGNQDGVSQDDERCDVRSIDVDAICTYWMSKQGRVPWNPVGVRMRDGRALPTYDWITEPLPIDLD